MQMPELMTEPAAQTTRLQRGYGNVAARGAQTSVPEPAGQSLTRLSARVALTHRRAGLEDEDVESLGGQLMSEHRACRPGTDHADVAVQGQCAVVVGILLYALAPVGLRAASSHGPACLEPCPRFFQYVPCCAGRHPDDRAGCGSAIAGEHLLERAQEPAHIVVGQNQRRQDLDHVEVESRDLDEDPAPMQIDVHRGRECSRLNDAQESLLHTQRQVRRRFECHADDQALAGNPVDHVIAVGEILQARYGS